MKARHWLVTGIIIGVLGILSVAIGYYTIEPVVLEPSGSIAVAQRDLLIVATLIMSLVAIPVFILLGYIAWRYRAGNKHAPYRPNVSSNNLLEVIWWGIPILIVIVLSVITWRSSHELDPFRPIASREDSFQVQVVALQWKWLFIYPAYGTASVNELIIPVDTPVAFEIAADSPMNSFWIPALGGQIYAMNGMKTALHLEANKIGEFKGVSSNISGEGFADMKFVVKSVSNEEFLASMQRAEGKPILDIVQYESLASPSIVTEAEWYRLGDPILFQKIIDKYMLPNSSDHAYDNNESQTNSNKRGGH